jgi:hypothetical protein
MLFYRSEKYYVTKCEFLPCTLFVVILWTNVIIISQNVDYCICDQVV